MREKRVRRTPDPVSKRRQKLNQEIEIWRAGVAAARREVPPSPEKILFGEAELKRCKKELWLLGSKAKKHFWVQ